MPRTFGLINEIKVDDPQTWENKIFLTSDIDWACDEVIEASDRLFTELGCKVTWLVTHESPVLTKLRRNKNYEFGIHPNFNPLLMNGSDEKGASGREIIQNVMKIVPEARCIRSHSVAQSSMLLSFYEEFHLVYDLNTFILLDEKLFLKPFTYFFNTVKLPYIWQDDVHLDCKLDAGKCLKILKECRGLLIVNFHPIQLFLNTEDMKRYNSCRPFLRDYQKLLPHVNQTAYGIRDFFKDFITSVQ